MVYINRIGRIWFTVKCLWYRFIFVLTVKGSMKKSTNKFDIKYQKAHQSSIWYPDILRIYYKLNFSTLWKPFSGVLITNYISKTGKCNISTINLYGNCLHILHEFNKFENRYFFYFSLFLSCWLLNYIYLKNVHHISKEYFMKIYPNHFLK